MSKTKKEQVLELLPLGLSNKEIADRVGCSLSTVSYNRWMINNPKNFAKYYESKLKKTNEAISHRYNSDQKFKRDRLDKAHEWQRRNNARVRECARAARLARKAYAEMKAKEARA